MSGEEITQKALERDLIETRGKTPSASIRAQLYVNIRDRGLNSKFVKVGRNLFGLAEWGGKFGLSEQTHRKKALTTKTYNTSDEKLLAVLKDEIRAIRSFIKGSGGANPSPDKSYFWIWFCYNFELFQEGALLFRKIDCNKIPQEIRSTIRKLGLICEEKM